MSIKNSNFESVSTYLVGNKYYIPDYQREYAWDEEQLDDFWRDLIQVVSNETSEHFLGQIVVHNDDGEKYIIDGQQRTITAVIFLAAIRNLFRELKGTDGKILEDAETDADDIQTKYIGRYTATRDQRQLMLRQEDGRFFGDFIQSSKLDETNYDKKSSSQKRLKNSYKYFYDKLSKEIVGLTGLEAYKLILDNYLNNFIQKFSVMYVETDDINEAFIIFETLNDRGKSLATADLLKNHILRSANQKIDVVKNNWKKMIDNLGDTDATKYIRHYWNSRYGFTTERDLYKSLRNKITSPLEAENESDALYKLAEVYATLNNPSDENYFPDSIKNQLIGLSDLKAKSFYPIILSEVSKNFTNEEIGFTLAKLEVLIVRNFVVSGLTANKFEKQLSTLARNIYNENVATIDQVLTEISAMIIDDEKFKNDFSTFAIKDRGQIRFLLRHINDFKETELKVLDDNNKVHIEHILPQKPQKWTDIDQNEVESYIWRFGNLTLLGQEFNTKASNGTFQDKRSIYELSQIKMTQDLLKFNEWNFEAIDERQKSLAKMALEILVK